MGDLNYKLPEYFGIKGVRATKERGYFLCKTSDGFVKIHKTSNDPRDIIALYELQKQLIASGFSQTDLILETPQGAPFLQLGRDIFIASRHIAGQELDLNNKNDIALALESLAKFHTAARGIWQKGAPAPSLAEAFMKQTSALTQVIKQVNRRPRMSDFDMLLIKNAQFYSDLANTALHALNQTNYAALHANALESGHICHNVIKEESLPIFQETCYILNLSEATINLQLADLESFIRRYARRSNQAIPIGQLVELYNKFAPLPSTAIYILHAQLSYPWLFMKLVSQYYSKKRNFTPIAIESRMTEILEVQENYTRYINELI
ncbi:MAG: hypothetical protein FWE05_09225 [Defluviitaleaceae bacterium]|nr:hypothetical protein [Defluviitaleaceae bacterium]